VMRLQGRPTLTRAKHRSGRRLYVEMTFALLRQAEGAPRGAVAVARDVTERVEQQRAAAASGQGTQTS
jgi:PAS domain S-box-containing protein